MVCYADLIRAGKELGCVAESARKTDTVEIEEIMKRSQKSARVLYSMRGAATWVARRVQGGYGGDWGVYWGTCKAVPNSGRKRAGTPKKKGKKIRA